MHLVIDIGNSNIVIGIYCDGQLSHQWRIVTATDASINWYKEELVRRLLESRVSHTDFTLVVLSSVVPPLTENFREFLEGFFQTDVVIVGPEAYKHLELEVRKPNEIGSDLVANAYAAIRRHSHNCLIIDFGTALTFLAAGSDWTIHGVSIAPGIKTALRSLRDSTARLPEVPLAKPASVLGRNTSEAIQSGVIIGYTGLVETMIERYREEWDSDLKVIATGGLHSILTDLRPLFHEIHPNLTMDGLDLIGQRVQTERSSNG